MKTLKLIMIILLTLLVTSCSSTKLYTKIPIGKNRTIIQFKYNSMEVDNRLLYYTEEFVREALSAGLNVDSLSHNFLGIYADNAPMGSWGITVRNLDNTYFSVIDHTVNTDNKLRVVIFHELSHYYLNKLGHCHNECEHIMSSTSGVENFYRNWEKQKEDLFRIKL